MITLKSDQVFGVYAHVHSADAPRLLKWLGGRKVDFLVDPADAKRLHAPGQTTIVFDEGDPKKIQALLLKIEKAVAIEEEETPSREGAYLPPVSELLTLGEAELAVNPETFAKIGITPAHTPELLRMALDPELHMDIAESTAIWGPIHAWRALAVLKAEEAIVPLITLFQMLDESGDEMITTDLPPALGSFGAVAIEPLASALADTSLGFYARSAASSSLVHLAAMYPESRDRCVEVISAELDRGRSDSGELNGFLVGDLLDLDGVEAGPIIEKAFAEDRVEESIAGDWMRVKAELDGSAQPGRPPAGDEVERLTLPYATPSKIGRNDQCPCGSGLKYKKCCGSA